MNTTQLVAELKEAGIDFNVKHFRYLPNGNLTLTYHHSKDKKVHGPKPEYLPRGGATIAECSDYTLNGKHFNPVVVKAVCSKKDNFCFKAGYQLVIERLHKMILT